jgi:hypothetical protein
MNRLVEIRTYKLKPGSRADFHELVSRQSIPLALQWQTDVVAYGPSLHDADGYFLIRAYRDLDDLKVSQDKFYSSDGWRQGPREAIISLIAADANAVFWLSNEAVEAVRNSAQPPATP